MAVRNWRRNLGRSARDVTKILRNVNAKPGQARN
jgi:hypothetical protein